ncbi:MAG: DUF4102 domain-containing protein [Desulfovibrio sp.]|nr:MAG: DUF4102 domain-containing protein [Desulfovibrio sp.]
MLTNTSIKNAKPKEKTYRIWDERGLYLEVTPSGGKLWRFKYRFGGREKRRALGKYPDVSLKLARERRDNDRRLLAEGIDPSQAQKAEKAKATTFEEIAREWFSKTHPALTKSYAKDIERRFERDIFPHLGHRPLVEITPLDLLEVLRRLEARGIVETAHRMSQKVNQLYRYAIASGQATVNIASNLQGALATKKQKHHASLTDPKEIAGLLRAIDEYQGDVITQCALRLAALTFVRPGELRHAEWSEFTLEDAEWRIPAEKMKMRTQHIVPLSRQSLSVLNRLKGITGNGRYVLPSVRSPSRPMSENTVNAALRRMGYTKEEMTGHGFRSMASTRLNEMGWPPDVIERQLAHAERNKVRAAYNRAEHLAERREMMQAWADYLDDLRGSSRGRG